MAARKTPVVLLTGFDAFGGERTNPSWDAVRRLHGERIARHRMVAVRLPTEFAAAPFVLDAALARHRPRLVLAVGQAGGRSAISLERAALNVIDARIADNAGAQPIDVPVCAGAPPAQFASVPIKAMVAALRAAGIPAEVSNSAGTFVCNALFFHLCLRTSVAKPAFRAGFVHVPFAPRQVAPGSDTPSMALDTVVRALRTCVATALRTREDVREAGGAVS